MSDDGMRALPKAPPYCMESEQSVLGAVMINNSAYYAVSAVITADDFFRQDHAILWHRLGVMVKARKPIDFLTVSGELKDHGELDAVGGLSYLGMLANDVPSARQPPERTACWSPWSATAARSGRS